MATNFITQHRRATAEEWEESGVIPYPGELVVEKCKDGTFKTKIGDGKTPFTGLPYQNVDIEGKVVDGLYYENNKLYLTINGQIVSDPVEIVGGGGGGGSASYSMRLINNMSSNTLTVAVSDRITLSASFYEYYGEVSTGVNGTLEVLYKLSTETEWKSLSKQSVAQNTPFNVNIASILAKDAITNVKFVVTGGESNIERSLTYNITQVEASISTVNFNSAAVYTGNVSIQYKCIGRNLKKTVYFEIDGEVYEAVDIGTSHNAVMSYTIQMLGNYEYGAHDLNIYFKTPDGATSNILKYTLLYDDGTSTEPMIGVVCDDEEITYGEMLSVHYVVYTPKQETTNELSIKVYSIDDNGDQVIYDRASLVNVANNTMHSWQGASYTTSGTAYIEFTSGNTVKTISVLVNEMQTEYNLEPVTTNLVYSYSANGRSNNDAGKELYECGYTTSNGTNTVIEGQFSGFNWVSNGYIDGESLTLSGDARHTIAFPMFATNYVDRDGQAVSLESATGATVTTNGRTFEVEFKVSNVTDSEAQIIKCMSSDHSGFVITPQNAYMLFANGADVKLDETGFIENEEGIAAAYLKDNTRIRLSFVIEPRGSVQYTDTDGEKVSSQCLNVYINGQYANSYVYPDNARFVSQEYITMGSNTCILNLYDVRIYNRGLSEAEILQNYKASPLAVQDKISRFEDNDVLTDDGDVDYYKAIKKYPCLLITGQLSPYKGANGIKMEGKVESGVTLTKPDGQGGYTVEWDLLDKDLNGNWVSCNNVQGTSSQKFPRKNYKIYLVKVEYNEDGTPKTEEKDGVVKVKTKKVKYSLKGKDASGNDLSIGESTLCYKMDFMSSDHANTFNANLADTLFDDVSESQRIDPRVQNTVWGFRCLLFRRDDIGAPIEFAGDGALNNDKGNTKTFGLERDSDKGNETTCQKWEFLNNTEALTSFKTDRLFEEVISEGKTVLRATLGLESTYPDQGDLKDEGLTPKYDYIQTLFTWVYQRANFWDASTETVAEPYVYQGVEYYTERDYRKAIFLREFDRHFNRNRALIYYLFMEFVALCDNRAKNMFLRCENVYAEQLKDIDGNNISIYDVIEEGTGTVDADRIDWENSTFALWITDLYDLDSGYGVENSGYMRIPYYADWSYTLNNIQQFNGYDSRLWLMVEEALADEIQTKAQLLTERGIGAGGLNYDTLYDTHIRNNAMLVCPAVVNRDMTYKYNDSWVEGFIDYSTEKHPMVHISDYKYLQRGSRTEQKDAFIYKRANMLYSKYKCKKFLNNNINFRCGVNDGVPASNNSVTITANQALYPAFMVNGEETLVSGAKTEAGTSRTIANPANKVGRSDTVFIAGGTLLTDIGDISKFKPYEMQLQNATGLRRLIIGSDAEGYENAQLTSIDTSGCKLLEELNIMGCTALGPLNLSRNGLLKKLYAAHSSVQSVSLPNGGVLEELHLGNIADLEIMNQKNLKVFDCTGYDSLNRLRIENTPVVNTLEIVAARLPNLTGGLRLVGINETLEDMTVLNMLMSEDAIGKYIDQDGVHWEDTTIYPYPYISGTVHVPTITGSELQRLNACYPYLNVTYDTLTATIIYMNENGTEELYRAPVYNAGNAIDPVVGGCIEMPTKKSTAQYDFTYGGWSTKPNSDVESDALKGVGTDRIVYVAFNKHIRSYTVRFYNGNILLQTSVVEYGTGATYNGTTPVKSNTQIPHMYIFDGWYPNYDNIVDDLDCYAQYYFDTTDIYTFVLGDFEYTTTIDTMAITKYIGTAYAGEIEAAYENKEVVSITGFENRNIEFIILPVSLQTIGANAFAGCQYLMSIHIPKNVSSIRSTAFNNCSGLEQITVDSENKTYHSDGNCLIHTKDKTLALGCVTSVIPSDGSVTTIGERAFYGCDNLTSVVIPHGITIIASSAFTGCQNLTSVQLPETLTILSSMAFFDCGMSEIEIPEKVDEIRMYAFENCPNLTTVTFKGTPTEIHAQTFGNLTSTSSPNLTTINVPWAEGEVENAPWGAHNATINYNYKS